MLLLAFAPMPYGYYMLLRVVVCGFFVLLALRLQTEERRTHMVIAVLFAVLFNPFAKISLGRDLWAIADIVAALTTALYLRQLRNHPQKQLRRCG
jgi:hypothetical protein